MKIHEYSSSLIKPNALMMCIGVGIGVSKLNDQATVKFYFADTQNRIWTHYQILDTSDSVISFKVKSYFRNLGFNMINKDPYDLYSEFNVCKNVKDMDKPTLMNIIGKLYYGKIVKRVMKGDVFKDDKKHVYWDIDDICDTRVFNQEKMTELFKKKNKEVYDYWNSGVINNFSEEDVFKIPTIQLTWKMKEKEVLESIQKRGF